MRSALLLIPVLLLTGCATAPTVDDGTVRVVASTNVYGSIIEAIGGDLVSVTSLIASAAQDPHSFEASAQDQLAVSKADLVVENGGGYDPFVDTLLDAASSDAVVITASEIAGLPAGGNEHLWYSFDVMQPVAQAIAARLGDLDPDNQPTYEHNLAIFAAQLADLQHGADAVDAGASVAITEPVPLYLLEEAGFTNITPPEFSEAIEEGTDVPPAVLKTTLDAVKGAALLAYNSQTASPETEQLRAAAEKAGVPVVEFTETLPDGETYLSWMTANLDAITAAIA